MRKNNEGKIIASLTEVKNKTGDIFALVDEFGEIVLTSYNKPRYRIIKISIDEVVELENTNRKVEAPKVTVKKVAEVKPEPVKVAPIIEKIEPKIEKQEVKTLINMEVIKELSKMKVWERDSKEEKIFTKRALMPLQ